LPTNFSAVGEPPLSLELASPIPESAFGVAPLPLAPPLVTTPPVFGLPPLLVAPPAVPIAPPELVFSPMASADASISGGWFDAELQATDRAIAIAAITCRAISVLASKHRAGE
jgi:hypothetical protein